MKPSQEKYDKIPALPTIDWPPPFFVHIPGVYCGNCGETFALYSYSVIWPNGLDENGKPYYNACFKCHKVDRLHS